MRILPALIEQDYLRRVLLREHDTSSIDVAAPAVIAATARLGENDTIWPVVEVLEQAAFEGCPFDIGVVYVHSANPSGAAKTAQVLRRWGYLVHLASGSTVVGYVST